MIRYNTQTLSSRTTAFWHYVVTPLWIVGCAVEIIHYIALVLSHALASVMGVEWAMLGLSIVGTVFTVWLARLIWAVRIEDDALVVTRYRRQIRVPLDTVESVRDDRVLGLPVTVAIRLRRDADILGRGFRFLPRPHWFRWPARESPHVAELLQRHGAQLEPNAPAV